jgi:hypothetical protein
MRSRTIQEGGLRKTMAHPNNPLENKPRLRILNEAYAEHMQIANRLNAIAIPNGK